MTNDIWFRIGTITIGFGFCFNHRVFGLGGVLETHKKDATLHIMLLIIELTLTVGHLD